jgi:hypothetical protein
MLQTSILFSGLERDRPSHPKFARTARLSRWRQRVQLKVKVIGERHNRYGLQ